MLPTPGDAPNRTRQASLLSVGFCFTCAYAISLLAGGRAFAQSESPLTEAVDVLPAEAPANAAGDAMQQAQALDVDDSVTIDDIVEPPVDYRFASFEKGDPFLPPKATVIVTKTDDFDDVPLVSALQNFTLNQLSLVGIWETQTGVKKALFLTPSGEGVVAAVNDPVGNQQGRVLEVRSTEVVVREFSRGLDGTRTFADKVLSLSSGTASSPTTQPTTGVAATSPTGLQTGSPLGMPTGSGAGFATGAAQSGQPAAGLGQVPGGLNGAVGAGSLNQPFGQVPRPLGAQQGLAAPSGAQVGGGSSAVSIPSSAGSPVSNRNVSTGMQNPSSPTLPAGAPGIPMTP